jgi:hypothetical protein
MKKSVNTTTLLLILLIGLAAWYQFYEKSYRPSSRDKEEQSKLLLSIANSSVQELSVQQQKDGKYTQFRFKRAGSDWNIVEPIEDLAEAGAVSGMVTTLTAAKQERVVEENPADLELFGLKTPKLKLTIKKDSTSPAEELWVGNDLSVGSGVYVKVDGKPAVYKASASLRTTFDKPIDDYRNKKILSVSRAEVTEVEVRTSAESFTLKKGEADDWTLTREGIPAATAEVNKLLNAAIEVQATGFAAEKGSNQLARFGLSPASATLLLKKRDGQSLLLLGKVKDKFYAKRGDKEVVYEVAKDLLEKAQRPSKDYRDLKLVQFNRFETSKLTIEHPPESFELRKEGTEWKLASDAAVKIDTAKVDDYLTRLQDARIDSFLTPKDKPSKPAFVLRLHEKKSSGEIESVVLKFAKPNGLTAVGDRKGLDKSISIKETEFKKINAFKQEFLASAPENPQPKKE